MGTGLLSDELLEVSSLSDPLEDDESLRLFFLDRRVGAGMVWNETGDSLVCSGATAMAGPGSAIAVCELLGWRGLVSKLRVRCDSRLLHVSIKVVRRAFRCSKQWSIIAFCLSRFSSGWPLKTNSEKLVRLRNSATSGKSRAFAMPRGTTRARS